MTRTAAVGIHASAHGDYETHLRIPGGANNVMTSPDVAAFTVTDIDASWFGSLDDVTVADQAVIGQWSTVLNQRSWGIRIIYIASVLQLKFWTSNNGSTSVSTVDGTAPMSFAANQYIGVRGTRRTSDGLVKMYFSSVDPPSWTLLGSGAVSAGLALLDSTAAMMIGGYGAAAGSAGHAVGYFRRAEVRNGFDGAGSLIATPDVRGLAETASGFTDSTGKVWTVGGAADLVRRLKV